MTLKQYLLTQPKEVLIDLFSDEEGYNEVATIVENPMFTWNTEFHELWSDVLESDIVSHDKIHENYDVLMLSGAPQHRIEAFQYILAGYIATSYWDKYHLPEEE